MQTLIWTIFLPLAAAGAVWLYYGRRMPPPASGFLENYSRLVPEPTDRGLMYWEKPGEDWTRFSSLYIDPVDLTYHPKSSGHRLPEQEQKSLAREFREVVCRRLEDRYVLSAEPGPGVLRIRAALTDLRCVSRAVNMAASMSVGVPIQLGGASMEAEFIDGGTGEVIGEVVAQRRGSPLEFNLRAYTRSGHIQDAFRQWADTLVASIGEVDLGESSDPGEKTDP